MIEQICEKEKCTGCTACMNSCPQSAISMEQNSEGFYYPVINGKLCINCKKCVKACPTNHFDFDNNIEPACYAVMASDELRKNSSSGAFFPVLANYVLENKGLVVGAAFDEEMTLCHIIISNNKDLDKLRGSKYLQSRLDDVFSKIKIALQENKLVLFTGTPCQVAGLNSFLGKKYDNLITADLVCHGVPSQKVFDNYLLSEFPNQKVLNTDFRDKKNGWGGAYITTTTTDKAVRSLPDYEDSYLTAFFENISLRQSCFGCKFAKLPRVGDFTMGDFWGVPKKMNDGKGTSMIFLNNSHAKNIFEQIKGNFSKVEKYPYLLPVKMQKRLSSGVVAHPARKDFFADIDRLPLRQALDKNLCSIKNVALLNFSCGNENFGALLTSFALNKFINDLGYNAQNIDYIRNQPWIVEQPDNEFFDTFRKKHLPKTKKFYFGDDLSVLNNSFYTFCVGSDQVWRPELTSGEENIFLLDFVSYEKNTISYAASFGKENLAVNKNLADFYKHRLSCFDKISVREESGLNICKKLGVNAQVVLDPVFLLDLKIWKDLALEYKEQSKQNNEYDIVYYTIDNTIEKNINEFIEKNTAKLGGRKSVMNITRNICVEEWLYRIFKCKFFITDSFHGCCFAIIFNKPFICVNPNHLTSARMKSMFEAFGIKNKLFTSFDDSRFVKAVSEKIDYNTVKQRIEKLREVSLEFLNDALNNHPNPSWCKQRNEKVQIYKENTYLKALKDKKKYRLKSYFYHILYKILFGKKRKKIKEKYKKYKLKYQQTKFVIKKYKGII